MITAEGLCKSFGAIRAVENVSFVVENKKSLCIQGRSGCGKTTLLKMLALILTPDSGNIFVEGNRFDQIGHRDPAKVRPRIGYSFQEPLLLPYLTALENIVMVLSPITARSSSQLRKEATLLLSKFGLSKRLKHYPQKLSVGEKKRVDLARAVLKTPSVLIADEPFSNLDPETIRIVMSVLRDYQDLGGSVIYSSTNPSDSKFASDCYRMTFQG